VTTLDPLSPPRAAIFDWDNTLIDSWAIIHDAMNVTLDAMGHPRWSYDETRARVRRSLREAFPELFGARWEEARDIFYGRFRAIHLDGLCALPDAESLLESLAMRGVWLGVVSNKQGDHLRLEARHLGWDRYFRRIVGATDAARDKPAPEPVHMALDGSGIAAGAAVWFVGDTAIDMECARNSGCRPVLLREVPPAEGEFAAGSGVHHFCNHAALVSLVRAWPAPISGKKAVP
jgi:phosphoglycolate phosphatase